MNFEFSMNSLDEVMNYETDFLRENTLGEDQAF